MAAPWLATWVFVALAIVGCGSAAAQPRPGAGFYDAAPLDDPAVGRCDWLGRSAPFIFQEPYAIVAALAGTRPVEFSTTQTVVDASTVVATHLSETIRRHGAALLRRQDVQNLLNRLKDTHPAIVDTLVPALLPLAVVHRVLQRLLGEGVSIRDLPVILEVLADMAPATKDPAVLAAMK